MQVDTTNILFICGGAFVGLDQIIQRRVGQAALGFGADIKSKKEFKLGELLEQVQPEDLLKFGLIPEFIGRLPVLATLHELNEEALVDILTKPKNSLVKQFQKLFEMDGVKLKFTKPSLVGVAREALSRNSGARGPSRHSRARDARHHVRHPVAAASRKSSSTKMSSRSESRRSSSTKRSRARLTGRLAPNLGVPSCHDERS